MNSLHSRTESARVRASSPDPSAASGVRMNTPPRSRAKNSSGASDAQASMSGSSLSAPSLCPGWPDTSDIKVL
ncbi:MAG: hypothetical protein LBD42_01725 [Desulfovibrio sp.]|nr:hypothetical protein [Desulfovibrio sp.]